MYYLITTDDKYAFKLEKFETEEEAKKASKDTLWRYNYKTIIKGEMIVEIEE